MYLLLTLIILVSLITGLSIHPEFITDMNLSEHVQSFKVAPEECGSAM